jgi:ribonuclease HII
MSDLAEFDQALREEHGITWLAGVDEVGRGCLAGPLCVAAVALPMGHGIEGIRDSKKLSKSAIRRLSKKIRWVAAWRVVMIPACDVDRLGIQTAFCRGVHWAVRDEGGDRAVLPFKGEAIVLGMVLIDGPDKVHLGPVRVQPLVHGDSVSEVVAAASIVAKDHRDRYMRDRAHKDYPEYGFDSHVGYGTPQHVQALLEHGPCLLHRKTFRVKGRKIGLLKGDGIGEAV